MPERGTEGVQPPVPDINLQIGLVMRSAAILSEDDDGALHLPPAELDGRPGTRAPHIVLADGRSTLDLYGSQFALLRAAGSDGVDDWAPPGVAAHVISADGFAAQYGLAAGGATLVRPDGVVAWRARNAASREDVSRAFATALAKEVF